MKATKQLKQLLQQQQTLLAPGIFDGLSARLIEQAGFSVAYASGGAIARSSGVPDLGLLSIDEVLERLRQITFCCQLPIVADADTGFGNELNVYRTVKLFEQAGVAGLHLEDQTFPKRCGHLANKSLISIDEMIKKIKIAQDARLDEDLLLIARTDAIAVEGFEQALERANAYAEAGADMIFVEAPESEQQIQQIAEKIPAPKLLNMFYGGKTPLIDLATLKKLSYQIVIVPSDLQRAAIKAMQTVAAELYQNGDSRAISDKLTTFQERESLIATKDYLAMADR